MRKSNVAHVPELHWLGGYPFALALMAAVCAGLYLVFERRGWL
jgi:magnesium transporter